MDYYHDSVDKKRKNKRSHTSKRAIRLPVMVFLIILISFAVGIAFTPLMKTLGGFAYLTRAKDTIMVAVAGKTPRLYYIDIEKNGEDYRLKEQDRFEVSYRDEFVVKKVSTNVLFNRGVTVDIEGIGTSNDLGALLTGIGLVDGKISDEKEDLRDRCSVSG